MTATEELRRLLDERGVEWWQSVNTLGCVFTCWYSPLFGDEVYAMENEKEGLVLFDHYLTPEQVIAATLGRETCHNKGYIYCHERYFVCSNCGCEFDYSNFAYEFAEHRSLGSPHYCPNCGAKVVD